MKVRGPLNDQEYALASTRAHGVRLLPALICLWGAMAAWSFASAVGSSWVSLPASLLALLFLGRAVLEVWRWCLTSYIVTSQRLIIRRGLSSSQDISLPLEAIEGVSLGRRRFLGALPAAHLTVHSRGLAHLLRDVPDPQRFSYQLRQAQEEHLAAHPLGAWGGNF